MPASPKLPICRCYSCQFLSVFKFTGFSYALQVEYSDRFDLSVGYEPAHAPGREARRGLFDIVFEIDVLGRVVQLVPREIERIGDAPELRLHGVDVIAQIVAARDVAGLVRRLAVVVGMPGVAEGIVPRRLSNRPVKLQLVAERILQCQS